MMTTINIHHVTRVAVEHEPVDGTYGKYGLSRLTIHFTDYKGNPQETRVTLFTESGGGLLEVPFTFSKVEEV